MPQRVVFHVSPSGADGWEITREDRKRPIEKHATKTAALTAARGLAGRESLSQVKIHRSDGQLQEERTYGKDPRRTPN